MEIHSSEAFEELLWHSFWPEKYRADRIIPWTAEDRGANDEFAGFIHNHIRKLLALRAGGGDGAGQVRYVSKNNANIARIPVIRRLFPDAVILVPFRNPVDQAGSMLRQRRNFMDIHAQDAFGRRYMAYTGHLDFGANLRPIDYNGWRDGAGCDVIRRTPPTSGWATGAPPMSTFWQTGTMAWSLSATTIAAPTRRLGCAASVRRLAWPRRTG